MSQCFSEDFFVYLSQNTDKSPEDIKKLIDDFFTKKSKSIKKLNDESVDTKEFIKETKKSENKETKKKSEDHKCERLPRGKSDPCGKIARNSTEINGEMKWYCGTKNSGCYHSILSSTNKKEKNEKVKKSVPEKQSDPQKSSDIKTKSLIHKIIKTDKIYPKTITMENKSKLYIDPSSRVLFYRDGRAYGILDKDDKTILDLTDDKIRWLESSGVKIEQKNKKVDSSEEEISLDESHSDDTENEEDLEESEDDESE